MDTSVARPYTGAVSATTAYHPTSTATGSHPTAAALATASRQYGLLSWSQARHAGLTKSDVRRLLRNGTWGHPYPRVYSVRALLGLADPALRLRTAAMAAQLALGPRSFAAGETAARLWGMQGLPAWDGFSVHMVIPALGAQRHVHGITLHSWDTLPEEVGTIGHGIRLTTPGRTLRDTLLQVDRETAVCLMDSVLNQGLVRDEDVEHLELANRGRRGCVRIRSWWPLADGRSASPLETRVRLVCTDGGLPPTDLQRRFHDGTGRLIGVVDFWWEEFGLIGEADGIGPHSQPHVLARDRERQNALQTWHPQTRVVRFTWRDLQRPEYILVTIVQAGARTPRT
ncbi:endonuclease domain-containing protein [Nocardiopsis alborubida]|uniref:endonuclease domain-containing protein n=1 Tax=Nocardiopsis alborubida TaxID=146802 RepID=UPI000AEA444A|nr:endonuclease domain-containing protein [Nocardiopsis alborubida]